ncbi:FYVE zinc finger [Teladorsagia circumcincta]|uniref:FYVE zinc finger n=1 Tax=Teladorsagia circumcincta TaxID=45464 RepID=A0A2G9UCH5_TELCI|nr:FYVE zinc finger [Teladorsagia circumcincta]
MTGNGDVCRCLLRYGATMGARNVDGATMFTYETPTRLLLFRLLDSLEREPRWSDGDMCDCGTRFSITVRKHHCRHCGRLVCAKCSEVTMPIAKYGEEKKVRVCSLCAEVLTTGAAR